MRRVLLTVAMVAAAAVAVPALAALSAQREAQPPQISINTDRARVRRGRGSIPGDTIVRCLRVRNEGAAAIGLAEAASVTGPLAPYLRIACSAAPGSATWGRPARGSCPRAATRSGRPPAAWPRPRWSADGDPNWAPGAEKSLRVAVALPLSTPNAAIAKSATVAFAFAGTPLADGAPGGGPGGGGTPPPGGGIAPGTTGGYDSSGHFVPNAVIKRRFRAGRARLLKNGNVVVVLTLPAGGSIRTKVLLPNHHHYGQALYPVEWGPKLRAVMPRRSFGRVAVASARRRRRPLIATVTARYRWAHGPDAFIELHQKLRLVR